MDRRWARLAPLALATMATQATMVTISPIVVEIGREFDASVGAVGQARMISSAAAVLATLGVGGLIDRVGVRPLLLWGGLLAVAGAGLSASAPSLEALYGAQVAGGIGVAAMLTGGFAGIVSSFHDRERAWAIGYVVAAQSIAWLVGVPMIGLLAESIDWRASYVVPAAAGLLVVASALLLPPPGAGRPADGERAGVLAVLRNASARRWTAAEMVAYAAWTSEITYIGAFYATEYGLAPGAIGLLMAGGSAIFALSTLRTDRILRRAERRPVIAAAALGMAIALPLGFGVTPGVWFTFATFATMAVFAGMRSTASSSLGLAQLPDRPGGMMAARTASAQGGYIVGAGAGGVTIDTLGFATLGFALMAVMLAAAVLVLRVEDPEETPAERVADAHGLPEAVD